MRSRAAYYWLILWISLSIIAVIYQQEFLRFRLEFTMHPWKDAFGRNIFLLTMIASARSIFFALITSCISLLIGTVLGAFIALSDLKLNHLLRRALELSIAFPSLLLALGLAAIRGPGWDTLLLSLAIGMIPVFTRLIYLRSQEILVQDYIHAASACGASSLRILSRHLLPALLSTCSVKFPSLFAQALLAEATLSFLGVGAPMGRETWGSVLAQGRDYLIEAPSIALVAGIPLVLTVLSLQRISDQLSRRGIF